MEDKRQFTGWFIPVELRTVHKLDWIECILWAEIYALSRRKKGCTASNEHLAARVGITKDRACRLICKLKDSGLVKQTGFDGRLRSLVATNDPSLVPENDAEDGCVALGSIGPQPYADSVPGPRQNSPLYSESVKGESTKGEATPFIPPSGVKNRLRRRYDSVPYDYKHAYSTMCDVCGVLFAELTKPEHIAVCKAVSEIASVFQGTDQQLADAIEKKVEELKEQDWVNNITPGIVSRYWNTPLK